MQLQLMSARASGAAGTDSKRYIGNYGDNPIRVIAIYIEPDTDTALDATDHVVFDVAKGIGGTSLGSHDSDTTALSTGVPQEITLSADGDDLELDPEDVLECTATNAGAGKAHGVVYRVVAEEIR